MEPKELSWVIPHPAADTKETAPVKTIEDLEG